MTEKEIEGQEVEGQEIEGQEVEGQEVDQEINENVQADTVPIATFLDLKKKYKEARNERDILRQKNQDEGTATFIEEKKKKYMTMGYNEELATELANDLAEVRKVNSGKNDLEEMVYEEISDLSKDPIYSDIKKYETEIYNKVTEAKKKGFELDVEDAYLIVSKHKQITKNKEKALNDEQRDILKNKQSGSASGTTIVTGASGQLKNTFVLDKFDKEALKALQTSQPKANWTSEKYYKMMVKDRI